MTFQHSLKERSWCRDLSTDKVVSVFLSYQKMGSLSSRSTFIWNVVPYGKEPLNKGVGSDGYSSNYLPKSPISSCKK